MKRNIELVGGHVTVWPYRATMVRAWGLSATWYDGPIVVLSLGRLLRASWRPRLGIVSAWACRDAGMSCDCCGLERTTFDGDAR